MENAKLDEVYAEMRKYIEALGYDCAGFELTSENDMNILRAYVDMIASGCTRRNIMLTMARLHCLTISETHMLQTGKLVASLNI